MTPYYAEAGIAIYRGDCRDLLAMKPDNSVDCVVTSPPYWGLRDYGVGEDALGLEPTPDLYVEHMVEIFREARRVLKPEGTCWLNIGDSYAANTSRSPHDRSSFRRDRMERQDMDRIAGGLKPKDLCLIPFRLALALQADGWYVRSDIIWSKPNPMPESVRDRPTTAHEHVFLLAKSERYYFDQDAVREPHSNVSLARARRNRFGGKYQWSDPSEHGRLKAGENYGPDGDPDKVCSPGGRNIRTVWTIPTQPFPEAHFAVFPEKLVEPCIKAGCTEGGLVLDPFTGAGTTAVVARRLGCRFIGAELNEEYCEIVAKRLSQGVLEFEGAAR